MDVSRFDMYSKGLTLVIDATNLISLDKHIPRIATAVEVSQSNYMAQSSELVKWQQAHVAIASTYIRKL